MLLEYGKYTSKNNFDDQLLLTFRVHIILYKKNANIGLLLTETNLLTITYIDI